jgi:hypothetical protein
VTGRPRALFPLCAIPFLSHRKPIDDTPRPACLGHSAVPPPVPVQVGVSDPPTPRGATVRLRHTQPAASGQLRCGKRDVTMVLRCIFDGTSMVLRRILGVVASFPPISAAHPPTVPPPISAFLLVALKTLPRTNGYASCAAQTPPPAALELAIQTASQPGRNFPEEPFLPHRFMLDNPAFCWNWPPLCLKPMP